ncbi:MAG: Gfo/Idh/MocA family oxidoreductase [Candidatus Limnocylindrales bacterium]|jgi:predicted dehydrogenase
MAERTYKVAVAALGKRGMHHATAVKNNPRFELVGVCDIDESRVEAARAQLGVSYGSNDAAKMLADTRPDVFIFCTLPQLRMPMIKAGVDAGVKLIAYEKPIAMSMNEAIEMFKLTRAAGIKTVVSHQHRYGDHYRKVKEIIDSGAIGRVHTVYGTSIGWMMHMFTHMIEYASWYNDFAEPEWVAAQAWGTEKFADVHTSPDYIGAIVGFTNGVRGYIETGADAPDVPEVDSMWHKCRIGAQGTEGFAEVLTGKAGKGGGWRAVTRDGVSGGPGAMDYDHDMPPYVQEIADWLDDDTRVHPCDGERALRGFSVMMAALRSATTGGRVNLPLGPSAEPELDALKKVLEARG